MTVDDWNHDIFLGYWLWAMFCLGLLMWTSLGEGWRQVRGKRIVFTPPWLPRLVGITMAFSGVSTLLLDQKDGTIDGAIVFSLFFSLPMFLVAGIGVQEFSADVEAGTYYTRRGIAFASKKTGRLEQLKGVQTMEYSNSTSLNWVFILRPEDKDNGGFAIGLFASNRRAIAAVERVSLDLHIPILPPRKYR